MADGLAIRVQGGPELDRALERVAASTEDPAVLAEIARNTAARLATAAPKKSGQLAASFHGRVVDGAAVAESSVPYAGPIQGGWPARGIAAQHYVERAGALYVPDAVDELEQHIDHEIHQRGLNR